MSVAFKTVLVLLEFNFLFAAYPPIDKCQLNDSSCLKASAQKAVQEFTAGVPELGTEVLDILKLDTVKIDLAGLKLVLTDGTLKGLKKSTIDKLKFNAKKKQIELKLHGDFVFKGHYVASGRLLILPISGDGQMTLKNKNMILEVVMPYEIKQNANGKNIIDIVGIEAKFDVKEYVHFNLTNLFNGNKELSDAMHQFINQNWKQIADEFGKPLVDEACKKVQQNIKLFLNQQAIEDITLP